MGEQQKLKRGRPSRLTPEVQSKIVSTLKACGTLEDAAAQAGVHLATLHMWKAKGRLQRRGKYRDFLDTVEEAIRLRRLSREATLAKAGAKDWRALAWLMERTEPKRYAPRVVHHIEEELTNAIDRLAEEFADEPEILERALAALAGGDRFREAERDAEGEVGADDRGGEAVQPPPAEPQATGVP